MKIIKIYNIIKKNVEIKREEEWDMNSKKINEILRLLQEINNLSPREAKAKIDSLQMTFEDFEFFTNEKIQFEFGMGFYLMNEEKKRKYSMELDSKTQIDFKEYNYLIRSFTRIFPKDRSMLAYYKNAQLHGDETISEYDIKVLEQIAKEWDDVRLKYDPGQEIMDVSYKAASILSYLSCKDIQDSKEVLQNYMEQLRKIVDYMDSTYIKDERITNIEDSLFTSMKSGLKLIELVEESRDLPLNEYLGKLGITRDEVDNYLKSKLELAEQHTSARPSILLMLGNSCKLNENGEVEILDEDKVKSLITQHFSATKLAENDIATLENAGRDYEERASFLSEKTPYTPEMFHGRIFPGAPLNYEKYGYGEQKKDDLDSLSTEELRKKKAELDEQIERAELIAAIKERQNILANLIKNKGNNISTTIKTSTEYDSIGED